MNDRAYLVSRTLELKIAIAENNNQNTLIVTLDALKEIFSLLKEQEAVKPVRDEQTGRIWLCGNCGTYVGFEDNDPHDPNEFDKYCRECGRPVLWKGRRSGNEHEKEKRFIRSVSIMRYAKQCASLHSRRENRLCL